MEAWRLKRLLRCILTYTSGDLPDWFETLVKDTLRGVERLTLRRVKVKVYVDDGYVWRVVKPALKLGGVVVNSFVHLA